MLRKHKKDNANTYKLL